MTEEALQDIYLNNFHKSNNAKFVPFAGYNMPINYKSGIINEHIHVRTHAGLFDVSHMGQILIPLTNENILALEVYIPLDIKLLQFNKCHYSFILNSHGGVVDDIMLSKIKIEDNEFIYIVYNASRKKVLNELFSKTIVKYKIIQDRCLIALQGPDSFSVISSILKLSSSMKFLDIEILEYENTKVFISRSGYTGEDGFEISILDNIAENFVQKIIQNKNTILCGLGCRDSLRMEAGLSLYGNELNEDINPIQAGLSWALDKSRLKDKNLNCFQVLSEEINTSQSIKRIGLSPVNKSMLRAQMTLHNENNEEIGKITSGCYSPILKKSIAIGYINKSLDMSEKLFVKIRDKLEEIHIEKIPFVNKNYKKGD